MGDSSTASFFRGIGYEMIDEGAQQDELADRKPRNGYKCDAARRRIEHPIRDLVGTTMRLPDQEMVNTVMLVVADHRNGLADQWMKRIGNHGFECQKPGTMAPARMAAPIGGPYGERVGTEYLRHTRVLRRLQSVKPVGPWAQWCP
jgi:hypothetical protein